MGTVAWAAWRVVTEVICLSGENDAMHQL